MTFHEDVNMRNVHESIYAFFNQGDRGGYLAVSIPYTIGVALGFVVLFGLFARKKKKPPTVLDIDIHEYEKSLRDYLSVKSKRSGG
jgi:stage V sporulation protein AA